MVSTNERPGVYSSIEVSSSLNGSKSGKTVGVAAVSETGEKTVCRRVSSYGEAVTLFGAGCVLTELIRILFLNGAFAVEAVPVTTGSASPAVADYEAAFGALMDRENVAIMICDSTEAAMHNAMKTAIAGASENSKYRIGIVETSGPVSSAADKAKGLNCERMAAVCCASESDSGSKGEAAAAVAGAVACGTDPALPLNGVELFGFDYCTRSFSDGDITTLVRNGVMPVERVGGAVYVVRGVTTRTTTSGEADETWRELTTVLIIDDVVPSIRSSLRVKFPRVKNTVQTRGAIRTQVIIELENKLKKEIIDSYGPVTAEADEDDPSVCIVSFAFTVAHGLNRINLTAHISV